MEDVSVDSRTPEELDKLADEADKPRNESRPMSAPKEPEKPIGDPAPTPEEGFEFEHKGQKVKATREQLLKWAAQGYNYPQLVQKLNQEQAKWNADRENWEKKWSTYKEIDEFATKSPDWWNFVQNQWKTRGQQPVAQPGQAPAVTADPKLQLIEQKFSQIEPIVNQFQQYLQTQEQQTQDKELTQSIQSIREKYKDLDWSTLDENGKNLELRVLEHAQTSGINSFKTAFLDLMHDQLVERAQSTAKLDVSKGIQKNTKLGVLGTSPTPAGKWSPKPAKDIRNTSYEDLYREALEELNVKQA